jgi:TolB-like protein/DNA-binding winged helix-turn-helix (wHTH) protein/Tfp pilus assembly protein PilF
MATPPEAQIFVFEGFQLDVARRKLTGPNGPIEVPSRAFEVLLYMVVHAGDLLEKATILKAVWPTTVVEEGNLSQCIFALRRALGDTASEPRFIATIPGRGYQFVAQVRESTPANATPEVARPGSRWPLYAGAGLALTVALLVAFRFWPAATPHNPSNITAPLASAGIAVLPFADLSPAKDMEYFADGIAEELMSSLSKVGGLDVIGRRSSFAFKGKGDDAQLIGEKLRVATILEGSVRKEGDRIRITAQLTRTRDGVSLWAETYDRKFDDVLDIQGSIAREVVAALAPLMQLYQQESKSVAFDAVLTRDAEAYRAYLRGVYLFTRWIDRDPQSARTEFLRAVERDPQFAKAYAMLARTYQLSAQLEIGDVAQSKSLASAALDKAMKLDPTIGDLWWVRLMFVAGDDAPIAVVASDLERAVAANPTETEPMLWLAHTYLTLGRRDEALQIFERAYATDPLSPAALWKVAWFGYEFAGARQRFLDRTDELERLLPQDPKSSQIRAWLASNEGRALDWDRFVARAIEVDPTNQANHCYLSADYEFVGGVYDAAMYHAQICSKLNPRNVAGLFNIARTQLFAGDIAAARKAVQKALARNPEDRFAQLAQGKLQYFTGDCAGALRSIAQARPALNRPEGALDLFHNDEDADIFVWCLRQQGNSARAAEMSRVFNVQNAPPVTAGLFDGALARMAAATGDRDALVAHLGALAKTRSMGFTFVRHEPMIQPYLKDAEVVALLDKLEERRAEWRRVLPKSSMRVPIPGIVAAN